MQFVKFKQMNAVYFEELFFKINAIYPIVLVILGSIGNGLVIIIFTSNGFKKTSTCFYFAFLAIVDTFAIYIGAIKFSYEGFTKSELGLVSLFFCKFTPFITYSLSNISSGTLVVISLERLFRTFSTKVFSKLQGKKFQFLIIISLVLLIFMVNIPILIYFDLKNDTNNSLECESSNQKILTINIVDFIFSIFLPFSITILSSIIILIKIKKSKNKISSNIQTFRKASNYMLTIITRIIVFFLLNSPLSILLIWFAEKKLENEFEISVYNFIYTIFNILFYFDYSINFFVHFTMNISFRKKFYKLTINFFLNIRKFFRNIINKFSQ